MCTRYVNIFFVDATDTTIIRDGIFNERGDDRDLNGIRHNDCRSREIGERWTGEHPQRVACAKAMKAVCAGGADESRMNALRTRVDHRARRPPPVPVIS